MYRKNNKIIAIMIILVMALANVSIIGTYGKEVYAQSSNLEEQTTVTNNSNVEFDAYFIQNNKEIHTKTNKIEDSNSIFVEVTIKNAGYLKNAKIEITDSKSKEANFMVSQKVESDFVVSSENNIIALNQIDNGTIAKIELPIEFNNKETIDITDFSKENIVKLTGIYVDGNGKQRNIEKEITVNLGWEANVQAVIDEQISKFIPYSVNGEKGLILQTVVKSNLKDNMLPVKETSLDILVPTINNNKPNKVKVVANSTKASNSDENAINFGTDNYSYNKETNTLNIKVQNNVNSENKINWSKSAQDEFVITYIYSEDVLKSIGENGVETKFIANSKITAYGSQEIVSTAKFEKTQLLKEQINNLVDFTINTTTDKLSKGYIYANYDAKEKLETQYNETIISNIGLSDITDKIVIEQNADSFVNTIEQSKAATTVAGVNYTYYKDLSISKEIFDKMLGEEGIINIYNSNTLISKIDAQSKEDAKGNITIDLSSLNINNIKIEISKPISEGNIKIDVTKAIKGNIDYSKSQMKDFDNLEMTIAGKAINGQNNITEQSTSKQILFVEPTSKANLIINKSNLSTVVTNENVEIRAILKTDSIYNKLYKNPTITIELPLYVESINIKDVKVLFEEQNDSELKVKSINQVTNANGTKSIIVELEGIQTKYAIGSISGGTAVILNTDITVNKLTPTKQEKIKMYYTNNNVEKEVEQNKEEVAINFVAPTGVVTTTSISGYRDNAQKLTSISGEEQNAVIETLTQSKIATFEMNVINNYANTIDNISILGRVPFKGNTEIITKADLQTTIDINLKSLIGIVGVDSNKVTVYYSEKAEANKDLKDASNVWTTTPTNIENIKSYLIVLNDYTMNTGDSLTFTYNAQIPENLQHNEFAAENYVVYFNNNSQSGMIEDKVISSKLGVTTGTGPVLETSIKSNISDNEEISTGKFIKYTLTVKNTGKQIAENISATINIPQYLNYIEFLQGESGQYTTDYINKQIKIEFGNIEASKQISKDIWVIADRLKVEDICIDESHYETYENNKYHKVDVTHKDSDYKTETSIKASIAATNLDKNIETNEVKNTIKNSYFNICVGTTANGLETINQGDKYEYNVSVRAFDANRTLNNTVLKTTIPEGLNYKEAKITNYNSQTDNNDITTDGISYDEKSRVLTINLGDVTASDNRQITITSEVGTLNSDEYTRNIINIAKVSAQGITEETSNAITDVIAKEGIKVSQTATVAENTVLSAGEQFTYKILIENVGANTVNSITIEDKLPEELQYMNTQYTIGTETKNVSNVDDSNTTRLTINIPKGQTAEVKINVTVKGSMQEKQIVNSAKISSDSISEIETNKITHKIEVADFETPTQETLKKISGQVWNDENNNGVKEENEPKMSKIEVMLFSNELNKFVTDDSGNNVKTTTDDNGNYVFKNIKQGKYTVIFLYDTANYSTTEYRKANVDEEKNSDAVDSKITIGEEIKTAAITEEINLKTENVYNIDLGLVVNKKFDLKLDKTVSSITVQNNTGTAKYEYENSKLAKRDLVGSNIDNTTVAIEYKIKVTNEGAVAGYVKKIVDYLPEQLKFSSELNKDWYTSENAALYNSSLSNVQINPGETKEVTLLLTKKMSDEGLGLINNTAEIYEAYNDLGIADIDSISANKVSNEDDMSSADVLLTVKTGKTVTFIGLSLTIIITIGIGAYFIKKKVLR